MDLGQLGLGITIRRRATWYRPESSPFQLRISTPAIKWPSIIWASFWDWKAEPLDL